MRINVLCPGPSLHLFSELVNWPGVTMALNKALLTPIHADVWCSCEADLCCRMLGRLPTHVYKNPPELRVNSVAKTKFRKALVRFGFTWVITPFRALIDQHFGEDVKLRTIFAALALSLEMGATEVYLYGCDMQGDGHFDARTGDMWDDARPHAWWDARWKEEREILARIIPIMEEKGVSVERVPPPVPIVAQEAG